jgi:indole-3-glycerol phosphate synthase
LRGGDADANAAALTDVLKGKKGPFRDVALLNAAAAIVVAGKAKDLKEGVAVATKSLDSPRPKARLDRADRDIERDMADILAKIEAYKREEIAARKRARPLAEVEAPRKRRPRRAAFSPRSSASCARRYALIAEIKKASPSKGLIREDFDPPALARAYRGGRRRLPVGADRRALVPGQARIPHRRAAPRRPARPAQGFLLRTLSGAEGARLGRGLHPDRSWRRDLTARRARSERLRHSLRLWTCWSRCSYEAEPPIEPASADIAADGINNRNLKTFETITSRLPKRSPPMIQRENRVASARAGLFTSLPELLACEGGRLDVPDRRKA